MHHREFLRRHWHAITIGLTIVTIACAVLAIWRTMPPHRITMAAGAAGGSYDDIARLYQAALARDSVRVELRSTAGSVENLAMLLDPHSDVSVAVIPSGIVREGSTSELVSLGAIFNEPLWWFSRAELQGTGLESLQGRRVSIGSEGSGTRLVALEVFSRAGILEKIGELLPFEPLVAVEKLRAGDIDVAFILASSDSPAVRQLLGDEHIVLSSYPRADALVALFPSLHKVMIPRLRNHIELVRQNLRRRATGTGDDEVGDLNGWAAAQATGAQRQSTHRV
jgi:TRAP-type uncharacterized transport system substrate-binding protein